VETLSVLANRLIVGADGRVRVETRILPVVKVDPDTVEMIPFVKKFVLPINVDADIVDVVKLDNTIELVNNVEPMIVDVNRLDVVIVLPIIIEPFMIEMDNCDVIKLFPAIVEYTYTPPVIVLVRIPELDTLDIKDVLVIIDDPFITE
jgi:hypothetical protein